MRISNDGFVGIGTTNPGNLLDISGDASATIRITDTTNTVRSILASTDTAGFVGTSSAHNFSIGTGATGQITIDTAGRVGINDTTPDYGLEVSLSSGNGYFGVTNAAN